MNRRALLAGVAGGTIAFSLSPVRAALAPAAPCPPVTPKRPIRIEQLGRVRVDDYAWLKPANWKEVWRDPATLDPAIRHYLEAEQAYSAAMLEPAAKLQASLRSEMAGWTAPELDAPALAEGAWAYASRRAEGSRYPRYSRRPAEGGEEQLLLDVAERAAGLPFLSVTHATPSPDGTLFAWAEDRTGAEKRTIFLRDLATGQIIEGPQDAYGDFVFSADSRWLFWTWRDANSRPARVYRRLARGGADVLVYREPDPGFLVQLTSSNSREYLFIRTWNDVTSEVRLINASHPEGAPRLVEPRRPGLVYTLEHWNDRFIVLTNADGAIDFKLMQAPVGTPGREFWRDWIAETRGRTITELRAFADYLVRVERVEGNPTVIARGAAGADRPVRFDEAAYAITLEPSPYAGDRLLLTYESPRTPRRWIEVALNTGGVRVVAEAKPPNNRSAERYRLLRRHATAPDGAEVPITILCRADLKTDGNAPLMLTGYGAYGISFETAFSAPNLALVDRGWVWAAAHVRGGSEKGRGWFEAARKLGKRRSFVDFIACAERLIADGYTRAGRIVPHGFSAGGLLVGVANNWRPDLWGGVIGQAPFVDMLNTMSDATHPLVPLTRPVWGDPLADRADYDNIAGYSPYENVGAKTYPPVLATTAIGDDRVGFWEPSKWIARLRERSTSGNPMLLHVAASGGHTGSAGAADDNGDAARMYAFAIWALKRRSGPTGDRHPVRHDKLKRPGFFRGSNL